MWKVFRRWKWFFFSSLSNKCDEQHNYHRNDFILEMFAVTSKHFIWFGVCVRARETKIGKKSRKIYYNRANFVQILQFKVCNVWRVIFHLWLFEHSLFCRVQLAGAIPYEYGNIVCFSECSHQSCAMQTRCAHCESGKNRDINANKSVLWMEIVHMQLLLLLQFTFSTGFVGPNEWKRFGTWSENSESNTAMGTETITQS